MLPSHGAGIIEPMSLLQNTSTRVALLNSHSFPGSMMWCHWLSYTSALYSVLHIVTSLKTVYFNASLNSAQCTDLQ